MQSGASLYIFDDHEQSSANGLESLPYENCMRFF
jgi:hypothetical protein